MGGWRHTLKVEGIPPGAYTQYPRNTHNRNGRGETVLNGGNSEHSEHSAYRTSTLTLPVDTLRPALNMRGKGKKGDDVVELAQREFKRLAKRLSRIMRPGYLSWAAENRASLYSEIWRAYDSFDTAERFESLKAGRITWRDYRALMLRWARLHVRAIRRHREHLGRINRHAA